MMSFSLSRLSTFMLAAALCHPVAARTLPMPANSDIIGEVTVAAAQFEDTFADLGKRHSLGYSEMVLANPGLDPWLPGEGTAVTLPTQFLLPDVERNGIVINLAEFRMYFFQNGTVHTFPVGVGTDDNPSPLKSSFISTRVSQPTWYPPESIRQEHLRNGELLPKVVPPGPENPLGPYAMRLGATSYLIHGSNKKFGIGLRVSHGCIRMYNEDVERLFNTVPIGTPVRIIDDAVKVGLHEGQVWMEVHMPVEPPADEAFRLRLWREAEERLSNLETRHGRLQINRALVDSLIDNPDGMPRRIGEVLEGGSMVHGPAAEPMLSQGNALY
ncbi:MAG: L,D-transpeptidase family protein [Gammaproteobacteria bacterium]|nr:L,D-transpeptidase family protein [Gammaproteobacteria bacterium]